MNSKRTHHLSKKLKNCRNSAYRAKKAQLSYTMMKINNHLNPVLIDAILQNISLDEKERPKEFYSAIN